MEGKDIIAAARWNSLRGWQKSNQRYLFTLPYLSFIYFIFILLFLLFFSLTSSRVVCIGQDYHGVGCHQESWIFASQSLCWKKLGKSRNHGGPEKCILVLYKVYYCTFFIWVLEIKNSKVENFWKTKSWKLPCVRLLRCRWWRYDHSHLLYSFSSFTILNFPSSMPYILYVQQTIYYHVVSILYISSHDNIISLL